MQPQEIDSDEVRDAARRAVSWARHDPLWFCKEILGVTVDPWQEELLEAVADVFRKHDGVKTRTNHRGLTKIAVRAGHGPGKTFGAALLMHWFNFVVPGRIPVTAPKLKQVTTRIWREFRKVRGFAGEGYKSLMEVDSAKITWCDDPDWCAQAETATEPENLQGLHDDYMLFIVEEASGVREDLFPAIEGALSTGTIVILVLISNPTKNNGSFYDAFNKDGVREHYYGIHVTPDRAPRISKKWLKQLEQKYGPKSPVVRVRGYGEFADSDENQLIALQWILDAYEREAQQDGSHPRLRIAADISDGGADETVLTGAWLYDTWVDVVCQRGYSFEAHVAPKQATQAIIRLFESLEGDRERDDIVVDAIGVGTTVVADLRELGYRVIAFKGGAQSDNPQKWRNRRTQAYLALADDFLEGRIRLREDFTDSKDDLEAQLTSIHRAEGQEKMEEIETKRAMRSRGVKSPDRADSMMMLRSTEVPLAWSGGESTILTTGSQVVE